MIANESDTTQQQILRALLSNPAMFDRSGNPTVGADYSDHPTYGAGLPRRIGSNLDPSEITAVVRNVVVSFPGVASFPKPSIAVTPFNDGATIDISYFNTITGKTEYLSFDINR